MARSYVEKYNDAFRRGRRRSTETLPRTNATFAAGNVSVCGTTRSPSFFFPIEFWAEVNIKPWTSMLKGIIEGSKRIKWKDRIPYAYWKGNPNVNHVRSNLMLCNVSKKYDWNARLYIQNWTKETKEGFKDSKLEDQCNYRYKIYVEGYGWSVSEKYIFACDSMVLFVKPKFYDFFTRSMAPMEQYWPIMRKLGKQCVDIKRAVQWGNNHTRKAKEIGKAGSRFIQENLKMNYIYDYMFHVLTEYAKLLQFKPSIPKGGIEVRSDTMARSQTGLWKKFMLESMVTSPSDTLPCTVEGQN
ncbi:protein O-glucosyltransferase 1-like [Jatropha curcas]|uniref:protein O-glucosyltransferase 1-like n=1 Tax=Jatropha curcas TaxID=180498 RepID=UPI001894A164|nr:protein O-glucosyltransferase 1-like [Jatropha curcas]